MTNQFNPEDGKNLAVYGVGANNAPALTPDAEVADDHLEALLHASEIVQGNEHIREVGLANFLRELDKFRASETDDSLVIEDQEAGGTIIYGKETTKIVVPEQGVWEVGTPLFTTVLAKMAELEEAKAKLTSEDNVSIVAKFAVRNVLFGENTTQPNDKSFYEKYIDTPPNTMFERIYNEKKSKNLKNKKHKK